MQCRRPHHPLPAAPSSDHGDRSESTRTPRVAGSTALRLRIARGTPHEARASHFPVIWHARPRHSIDLSSRPHFHCPAQPFSLRLRVFARRTPALDLRDTPTYKCSTGAGTVRASAACHRIQIQGHSPDEQRPRCSGSFRTLIVRRSGARRCRDASPVRSSSLICHGELYRTR